MSVAEIRRRCSIARPMPRPDWVRAGRAAPRPDGGRGRGAVAKPADGNGPRAEAAAHPAHNQDFARSRWRRSTRSRRRYHTSHAGRTRAAKTYDLPGQYVVLRLRPPMAGVLSPSRSRPSSTDRYRISVKVEPDGVAGTYLRQHVRVGDIPEHRSPARALFSGRRRVVLLAPASASADSRDAVRWRLRARRD